MLGQGCSRQPGAPHDRGDGSQDADDEARAAYRRRKWLAEPPNGRIKNIPGFRQLSLRTLPRAQAEWKIVCLAHGKMLCRSDS